VTPEEIEQSHRTFGDVIDAHNAAGDHRMHFTGLYHPTVAGQYFWHCLDCKWYLHESESGVLRAHAPVFEAERIRACGSCKNGVDLHPKYPERFREGRVGSRLTSPPS
jgi:hypothetical protein